MEIEQKFKLLQMVYAGALADSTLRMGNTGVLKKITEEKRKEQMLTGKTRAAQFGISKPEEVFMKLSEVFGCAIWRVEDDTDGFSAEAMGCILCSIAKKIGAQCPCYVYCLDPMEGMIKGVDASLIFDIKETLWGGSCCRVEVYKNR